MRKIAVVISIGTVLGAGCGGEPARPALEVVGMTAGEALPDEDDFPSKLFLDVSLDAPRTLRAFVRNNSDVQLTPLRFQHVAECDTNGFSEEPTDAELLALCNAAQSTSSPPHSDALWLEPGATTSITFEAVTADFASALVRTLRNALPGYPIRVRVSIEAVALDGAVEKSNERFDIVELCNGC
jgi:hypothetical protein